MRLIDRIARTGFRVGLGRRGTALLETTGRKSGTPRVTPVTNGLDGDVFWIVTERGHRANYVRNIEAEPRVRVNAGGGWQHGTAQIVEEDPEQRLRKIVELNARARQRSDRAQDGYRTSRHSHRPRPRKLSRDPDLHRIHLGTHSTPALICVATCISGDLQHAPE